MTMTFLAVVGERCAVAEVFVTDVLIESGVVGENPVSGILSGKHYSRAMCCHKILLEALL